MHILQNDFLKIESKVSGGELTRIYSKKQDKEILWNADSKHWGRHSPILFPIVGRLKDNTTIIEDKAYTMSQHGFARDLDFEAISINDNSISYRLVSSETTYNFYPYDFELIIKYTLENNSVNIEWNVTNKDNKDIYFSIGAHPAFNLSISNDKSISDCHLNFKCRDNVNKITLNGPFSDKRISIDNLESFVVKPELFSNEALIYTNVDEITIQDNKDNSSVKINFKDFPLVGIWTPYYKDTNSTAPFLCIEPWYGIADNINSSGKYIDKDYINKLSPSEIFTASYSIIVD